jgi:4-amino-4-deoxychorismate lyase
VLACQPRLAGVKHLNRLEQVLARSECERLGHADAWMSDSAGFVVATTMRNLFFVDDQGRWHTPAITRAGIIGATRQRLIRAMRQRCVELLERDISPQELEGFVGALACNSVGGIAAVERIDGRELAGSDQAAQWARGILDS